jgi:hypothetical protein
MQSRRDGDGQYGLTSAASAPPILANDDSYNDIETSDAVAIWASSAVAVPIVEASILRDSDFAAAVRRDYNSATRSLGSFFCAKAALKIYTIPRNVTYFLYTTNALLYGALIALNLLLPNVERKDNPNAPIESRNQEIEVREESNYLKITLIFAVLSAILIEIYFLHFCFRGRCTRRSQQNFTKDAVYHTKICLALFVVTFVIASFQKASAEDFGQCKVGMCLSNLRLSGLSVIPSFLFLLIVISLTVKPEILTQQEASNPSCGLSCFNGFIVPFLDRCLVIAGIVLAVMFFVQMLIIREEQDGDQWGYTEPKEVCQCGCIFNGPCP